MAHKDTVFKKLQEMAINNRVSFNHKDLAKEMNVHKSAISYSCKHLVDEGKIKLIQKAKPVGQRSSEWSPSVYEISSGLKGVVITTNPIVHQKTESFHNVKVRLIKNDGQWVIPLNDICDGLSIDRSSMGKLIERNIEIFKDLIGMVVMTTPFGQQEFLCLTRDGIIGLLMKISYKRLPKEKQQLVIDFQRWAIEKLSKLITDGRVELSEQEHSKVQKQVGEVTGMNECQIDMLFNDLEDSFSEFVGNIKHKMIEYEAKLNGYSDINKKLMVRTQQFKNMFSEINL